MLRCVKYWALAGFLVPVAILILHACCVGVFGVLALILWPSSFMLMGAEGSGMGFNVIVLAIPIAINVALYSMLGALLYAGWEFVGWVTR